MLIFSNRKIQNIPNIQKFLQEEAALEGPIHVGWGRKASFQRAQYLAQQQHTLCLCVEDGFIRSLGLGKHGHPPFSLVVDHCGIYFDARHASDLEHLIEQEESEQGNQRAEQAVAQILRYKVSKYNQRYQPIDLADFSMQHNVLIVDQTVADQSIRYAGAESGHFQQMLAQAHLDHPNSTLWIKTHPDVIAGQAQGHFSSQDFARAGVKVIGENYNPIELLQQMDEVYVVSSQLGFEALLCGKKVHCFALPWYAGWGLTDDQYAPRQLLQGRRQLSRSLWHLFACAYFNYARYVSPVSQQRCELETLLSILQPNIALQDRLDTALQLYGFSSWKKSFLKDFLNFPQSQLAFYRWIKPQKNSTAILAWGKSAYQLKRQGFNALCTVEDGFIRSIGLGAALTRPCSLVFDPVGIYYDATTPSYLEQLLNQCDLSPIEIQRARRLKQRILALNISKYNVGVREALEIHFSGQVILVVGQVEDDMSVLLGSTDIQSNVDLLRQVRLNHPDAYIIYKPHPDVNAGLRSGMLSDEVLLGYANQIEVHRSIIECFAVVDEVHTITSLTGFEALIRGIKVVCYGMPFYAGWGLTQDRHRNPRRVRQLRLEELLYVVLIEYAVYSLPRCPIALVSVEALLDDFETQSKELYHHNKWQLFWMGCLLKIRNLFIKHSK